MLLQDLLELYNEEEQERKRVKDSKKKEEEKALDLRKRAMETLTPEKGDKEGNINYVHSILCPWF